MINLARDGLVFLCALFCAGGDAGAASCDRLAALSFPDTTIESATEVPAGTFSPRGLAGPAMELPAFCRVLATVRPVPDSEISIEVWLPPAQSWNGKLAGTGNGGYSGAIGYRDMASALKQGYAATGSNTGHEGDDLKFGVGHPEKINDWAYRAVHVMTETAKLVIRNHYSRFPEHAYFIGCSTGGQQALTEAQRYPADYDGIVAGAPGNNRVRLNVGFLWSWLALQKNPAEPLSPSVLPAVNRAAVEACDQQDGLKDGLIGNPRACRFDPGALLCKNGGASPCLTQSQVDAIRLIYDGARNPRSGETLFAGWARGSEGATPQGGGWSAYFVGRPEPARVDFWRHWVFHDPGWDPRTFDFDRDVAYTDAKLAMLVANDAKLAPFRDRKGKLLLYHGWADPVAPPEDGIRYYESVQRASGGAEKTAEFARLFLAPGMGHCGGGPGPNTFDSLGVLDRWVTSGTAPDRIVASHSIDGKVDRTRPLCPYPQVARWDGSGNIDDAASFSCGPEPR